MPADKPDPARISPARRQLLEGLRFDLRRDGELCAEGWKLADVMREYRAGYLGRNDEIRRAPDGPWKAFGPWLDAHPLGPKAMPRPAPVQPLNWETVETAIDVTQIGARLATEAAGSDTLESLWDSAGDVLGWLGDFAEFLDD